VRTNGSGVVRQGAAVTEIAVGILLLCTLYLAASDQVALLGSGELLHESLHDGRHVLGFPCH
jgi:hypothetical protein